MKRILFGLMLASPLIAINECTALVRTERGYSLQINGLSREVNSYDVDARLRSMNGEQLGRLAAIGGLKAHQMSNGDYRIEIGGGLKGGGAGGAAAGSWAGRFLGYGLVYGGSALVLSPLLLIPGGGPAVYGAAIKVTWTSLIPVAETAATAGAIAGGIAGGVATGPV